MARTRSQPISPGGYQSLPDKPTRRRTKRGSASIDAEEEAPATKKTKTSTAKAATTKPTTSRRRTTRATSVEKKTIEKPAPITSTTTRRATRGSSVDVVIQSLETKKENKDADKPVEPITTTKTRPRTRSQPLSPNGLQMLAPKPRQRRSASVDQPESQISTAKKAPVKKSAGRKAGVTKKRAPKTKTSNKPLSEAKNTKTRTDEVLRPISATPIRRNATSRRIRIADFDSRRTLFNLEETVNVQLGHQASTPKSPPANNSHVTSEIASPHTPPRASPVSHTPSPPKTAPASTSRGLTGWTQLRNIYNSVTRRWGTITNRIGRRGSDGSQNTSPESVEGSAPEPHLPQQAPNVHSEVEPFPAVTEEMARGSEEMARGSPLPLISPTASYGMIRRTSRPNRPRLTYDYSIRGSGFTEEVLKRCYTSNKRLSPPPQPETPAANKQTDQPTPPEAPQKRKRRSSPDVIPNPPGASYGMADGFFDYDSEDEREAIEEQARRDAAKNPDGPPSKKQDVHGARRRHVLHRDSPRAAESRKGYNPARVRLYAPTELSTIESSAFLSDGDIEPSRAAPNGPTLTFETPYSISSTNDTDVEGGDISSSPGPVLGRAGPTITFRTPYSDSSSDKEEESSNVDTDGDSSLPLEQPGASPVSQARNRAEQYKPKTPSHDSTLSRQQPGASPVSRARNRAEQYKPKTPSRLRQIDQTSPHTSKSDQTPQPAAKADQPLITANTDKTITAPSDSHSANRPLPAGTANWLKLQCPAGDVSTLLWPEFKRIDNAISTRTRRLVEPQCSANNSTVQHWRKQMEAAAQPPSSRAPSSFDWPEARPANTSFGEEAVNAVQSKWTGHKRNDSVDSWKEKMTNFKGKEIIGFEQM